MIKYQRRQESAHTIYREINGDKLRQQPKHEQDSTADVAE
jgi:hypothetical protein